MAQCELTYRPRAPLDVALAAAQHAAYEDALTRLGCSILRLDASAGMPDCVFVEDTAVVLDEIAVIARPGAASRRPETTAVIDALEPHRPIGCIEAPATLDGGDVLAAGRAIYVGRSRRTNDAGAAQMRALTAPFGYTVRQVAVEGCLHLKSAVTAVSDGTLLINPAWVRQDDFAGFDCIAVDPKEAAAANIVRIGNALLYSSGFPHTLERLQRRGLPVTAVDVGEIAKAEGAVTCCSLIFKDFAKPTR